MAVNEIRNNFILNQTVNNKQTKEGKNINYQELNYYRKLEK